MSESVNFTKLSKNPPSGNNVEMPGEYTCIKLRNMVIWVIVSRSSTIYQSAVELHPQLALVYLTDQTRPGIIRAHVPCNCTKS